MAHEPAKRLASAFVAAILLLVLFGALLKLFGAELPVIRELLDIVVYLEQTESFTLPAALDTVFFLVLLLLVLNTIALEWITHFFVRVVAAIWRALKDDPANFRLSLPEGDPHFGWIWVPGAMLVLSLVAVKVDTLL